MIVMLPPSPGLGGSGLRQDHRHLQAPLCDPACTQPAARPSLGPQARPAHPPVWGAQGRSGTSRGEGVRVGREGTSLARVVQRRALTARTPPTSSRNARFGHTEPVTVNPNRTEAGAL
jgi:hypothetical protein